MQKLRMQYRLLLNNAASVTWYLQGHRNQLLEVKLNAPPELCNIGMRHAFCIAINDAA